MYLSVVELKFQLRFISETYESKILLLVVFDSVITS